MPVSSCATGPVQWETSSHCARSSGVQGVKPRSGSGCGQLCAAQYEPSGALQAATTFGRAGPSYVPQLPLKVFQYSGVVLPPAAGVVEAELHLPGVRGSARAR